MGEVTGAIPWRMLRTARWPPQTVGFASKRFRPLPRTTVSPPSLEVLPVVKDLHSAPFSVVRQGVKPGIRNQQQHLEPGTHHGPV